MHLNKVFSSVFDYKTPFNWIILITESLKTIILIGGEFPRTIKCYWNVAIKNGAKNIFTASQNHVNRLHLNHDNVLIGSSCFTRIISTSEFHVQVSESKTENKTLIKRA